MPQIIINYAKDLLNDGRLVIKSQTEVLYILIIDSAVAADREIILEDEAILHVYCLFLNNNSRINLKHTIGQNSVLISNSLVLSRSQLNVIAEYDLVGHGGTAFIKADAILNGSANLNYEAVLRVKPAAEKSDSRVDLRLYLNSPEARGRLIPQLKVAASDVQAGHSAGTFKLSADDLFYLQARGLSDKKIKALQLKGLSNNFVQGLDSATAKFILDLITKQYD